MVAEVGTVNASRSLGMEVPGSGADCGNDVWTIETEAGVSIPGHCKRSEENNFNRSCCAREGKLHTDCNVNWTSGSLDLREGCRQGLKDPKKGWGSKRPAECSLGNCVSNGAKQPVPSAHSAESKWKLGLGWICPCLLRSQSASVLAGVHSDWAVPLLSQWSIINILWLSFLI